MIGIGVVCTRKNSKLESSSIVTEVEFVPINQPIITHAAGAVIGMPNDTPTVLTDGDNIVYNILSGSLLISILNETEAEEYKIGESYTLTIDKPVVKSKKAVKE